ncbi:Aminoacyl-histidine dipeptidase (Peptidase D) [Lachnospiraceae bacterium TWA4]|nr:Aminoacyl-histidine dipeptidase (Peptidase D) [Lachnospiraceae bacterium TWA4]
MFNLQEQGADFYLGGLYGGEKDNAIATFAHAKLVVSDEHCIEDIAKTICSEFQLTDPTMKIELIPMDETSIEAFSPKDTTRIILALTHLPYGVQKMSLEVERLVQTSLNLGILTTYEDHVSLDYSVRSSIESEKDYLIDKLCSFTEFLGGECVISGKYPGWAYEKESKLRDVMVEAYEKLYGEKPILEGMHAGVECGLFADKLEGLDCISIGPQMYDIHTTKERLSISSSQRTWELVLETLRRMNKC